MSAPTNINTHVPADLSWPMNKQGEPLRKAGHEYSCEAGSRPNTVIVSRKFQGRIGLYRVETEEGSRERVTLYLVRAL